MKFEKLVNIVKIIGGNAAPKGEDAFGNEGLPFVKMKDLGNYHLTNNLIKIENRVSDKVAQINHLKIIKKGSILLPRSGSVALNHRAILGIDAYMVSHICALEIKDSNKIFNQYLYYYLTTINFNSIIKKTTGLDAITFEDLAKVRIPIPDYQTQLHIANLLSKAENLISQRKESIRLLDKFLKSTFLEMFGDPAINKNNWETMTLKKISLRFSDGPFGSNLKTEHYSDSGIQVIRLQNIGINKFIEEDVNFVSVFHYETVLKKYTCYPGDVVIATMGSPNIRACIVPKHIKTSINKADCVLFRVNPNFTNQYYVSHLLNQEGFLFLAGSFIHGQTRARISSGQLAKISIPIPPLELQTQFAQIVEKTEALKKQYQQSLQELENLYGSLSQRAFKGELKLEHQEERVLMAAEPKEEYKTGKVEVLPILQEIEENYFVKRKVLATYIINQSLDDKQFGNVKFEKLLHLSDYFAIKRNLGQKYYQKAAGPLDNAFTNQYFIQIEKSKWFLRKKIGRQYLFSADENHSKSLKTYNYFSEEELNRVNKIISYFKRCDYEQPEIVSTLYAVWNNRLIKKQETSNQTLIADFYDWDNEKKKYPKDRLQKAIQWMKDENLIPDGWGNYIDKPKTKKK